MALNELADAAHLYITNFAMETLLLMQNLWYAGQALIAFFSIFLRDRGQNARCQNVRHHAEEKNCCGKHRDCSLLQKIGPYVLHRCNSRKQRCIDENRFQHEKVIIQRDETANQAQCDKPKKRVIWASVQCGAEQ